jgi:hypothetical protein
LGVVIEDVDKWEDTGDLLVGATAISDTAVYVYSWVRFGTYEQKK